MTKSGLTNRVLVVGVLFYERGGTKKKLPGAPLVTQW